MNDISSIKYTTDYISGVMSLRTPQEKSLKILDSIIKKTSLITKVPDNILEVINNNYPTFTDFERDFPSLTFALATGVGKTRLMGAFITYLYTNYGIKNFLVVAPSTTIYEKLKKDLGSPEEEKYVFKGLGCFNNPPKVVADDDFNITVNLFESEITIYVYNISKFDKENTKMKAFSETRGMSFYDSLAEMKDLVIIMDESHHYRADKGMETINNLKPILGLELTATPLVNIKNKQVPFKNVVYEYPLSEAIKDGYTRVPYAVTRTDIDFYHFGDEALDKLMLSDGIKCHEMIKEKLSYYAKTTKSKLVKPFMLVVCKDITHAAAVEKYIKSNDFENGEYKNKTIVINSKQTGAESEANTKLLLDVEKNDNPVEIVIHVNMLKEGWDVNNLYTIVPLRTASSKILREQMVGRGLRLPYGERTGNKEIDAVMLTAHDKFQEILDEAAKGDSIFHKGNVIMVEDIENEKNIVTQLSIPIDNGISLNKLIDVKDDDLRNEVSSKINKLIVNCVEEFVYKAEETNLTKDDINNIKSLITDEIKSNEDYGKIYEKNAHPIEAWIAKTIEKVHDDINEKFILIPRIKTEREEGEYYFEEFDLDLKKFKQKPIDNEILIRNMLDTKDEERIDGGFINFDAVNPKKIIVDELRKKSEIDYNKYSSLIINLVSSLTDYFEDKYSTDGMKNIVMMYKIEISEEIYSQMLDHFVRKEGLLTEEVFTGKKVNLQSNYSYNIIKNIFDSYDSTRDGRITSILFDGICKGVFSSAKFDSYPELLLAKQLERDDDVITWLRPAPNEFNITYNNGKKYEPDFVVEGKNYIYLIEVKGDNQLDEKDVLLKKERAISYCDLVSKWANDKGYKEWRYLFIPASKIGENITFKYLAEKYIEK